MKTNINSLFKCSRCELNFLSKEGMEKHYTRVHEGKGVPMTRFKCDKCNSEFDTKQDFKKHKAPQKYPCDGCQKKGQTFLAENKCEFTKHLNFYDFHKKDDVKNKKMITCVKCKIEFKNSQLLQIHKNHTGKVSCKKPNCGKTFSGSCKLEKHKRFDDHKTQNSMLSKSINPQSKLATSQSKPNPPPSTSKPNPPQSKPLPQQYKPTPPQSKPIQIIKPAVINLEKLQLQNEKNLGDLSSKASDSSTIFQKTKDKEKSKIKDNKKLKDAGKEKLVEASNITQNTTLELESIPKLLADINFYYPTFTEEQLLDMGVFDEFSSSNFLPPFVPEENSCSNDENMPDSMAGHEDIPPDTFDGVCILGF